MAVLLTEVDELINTEDVFYLVTEDHIPTIAAVLAADLGALHAAAVAGEGPLRRTNFGWRFAGDDWPQVVHFAESGFENN